jgi:hypothetical protein
MGTILVPLLAHYRSAAPLVQAAYAEGLPRWWQGSFCEARDLAALGPGSCRSYFASRYAGQSGVHSAPCWPGGMPNAVGSRAGAPPHPQSATEAPRWVPGVFPGSGAVEGQAVARTSLSAFT